jgi:RNA polymerase sigma-70 factor (ECF subfamily)
MGLSLADFNRMVEDHGPAMYRLAYRLVGDRHEAEDVVQDAFRSAWKSRESFRPDGGPRAWLAAILRRRVVDHWRHPRPPVVYSGDRGLEVELAGPEPGREEYSDEMQRALGDLPQDLRETLLLVVVAELTHQEAADLLCVPLGTVLSRVSRARKRLRELLIGGNGQEQPKKRMKEADGNRKDEGGKMKDEGIPPRGAGN